MEIKLTGEELAKKKLFVATPMYGGMCAGMYTKSMADLTAVCTKYNIELQYFALFNESLITRARNYCVDEFLRSKMDYLLFLDADIGFDPGDVIAMMGIMTEDSPYDVLCAPYPKKSYDKDTPILTEDGIKKVEWIVKNKYSGKVMSYSSERGFEWQSVINWFESFDPNKKWVKLYYQGGSGNGKSLTLTHDHDCMFIKDIMNPLIEKLPAEVGKNKWAVSRPVNRINPLYTKDQLSFLIGTLLGNATLSKKEQRLSIGHESKQKEYLELKQKIFGGEIIGPYTTNKNGTTWHLISPVNAQTRYIRNILYENGKKTVKNILKYVDEKSLAFWILDDGCLHNNNGKYSPYYRISTEGFSDEDQYLLVDFLKEKWDIEASIVKNGKYNCLYINTIDSKKVFDLISPYIPDCMKYKIPEKYHYVEKYIFNGEFLNYGASLVKEVKWLNDEKRRNQYDITVDVNHNFVTKNIAIFQCISWEKIVQAVNKGVCGPNDENPNILDKFVGDYVFNPKSGTGQIPIGEPCEILEGGTGFMMIRRNTLVKFQEAFPQYMYRPDHVRTEHFDGRREICQFFQAEIDVPDLNIFKNRVVDALEKTKNAEDANELQKDLTNLLEEYNKEFSRSSKRYLSEDYWFSIMIQKIGLKIWLCPWMKTNHMGNMIYGGSLADLASIGASPTAEISKLGKKP